MVPVVYIVPQAFYDMWKNLHPYDDMKGFQAAKGIPNECMIDHLITFATVDLSFNPND